ncbi:MAG TPA: 30S ribosomal protein S3 [Patescibacteria group bacterium]
MGHKVHPKSARLLLTHDWDSKWFDIKNFATYVVEDARIRSMVAKKLGPQAAIDRIVIERKRGQLTITLHAGRPGVIIGRAGAGINDLRQFVEKQVLKNSANAKNVKILVSQIKIPELSAAFVAQNIGQQITRRINYRRAVKQAIEKTMQRGAKGIKVAIAGRLNGAEIARSEKFIEGKLPLSQFKADIDYALYHTPTTYGVIGVKVWIYKGDMQVTEGDA